MLSLVLTPTPVIDPGRLDKRNAATGTLLASRAREPVCRPELTAIALSGAIRLPLMRSEA